MKSQDTPQHADVEQLFNEHGLRCTRQRRAIYEMLASSDTHPTADQIYRGIAPQVSGLSLATVYNTLEAFCRCGLAQKVSGGNGSLGARFDATTKRHLHLRCRKTGHIYDVPTDLSRKLLDHIPRDVLNQIESQLGVKIDDIQVELIGHK